MLVIKRIYVVAVITISVFSCAIHSEELPFYSEMKSLVMDHETDLERFVAAISSEKNDLYLQYLEGNLSHKTEGNGRWEDFYGENKLFYSKLMNDLGVRFSGKVGKKVYLGGRSQPVNGRVVLVEMVRYTERVHNHSCTSNYLAKKNGSCISKIKNDWFAHYSWISYE